MRIRVRVCPDRNARAAAAISELLDREPDMEITHCRDECSAPGAAGERAADVVIIPVGFPDVRDLTHLHEAVKLHASAPLIVLGLCQDATFIQHLQEAGATAVLALDEAVGELPPMIRRLAAEDQTAAQAT